MQDLLAFIVFIAKSGVILIGLPIYVTWSFSFAALTDFLQRLTKAVQLEVTDPEARHVLIETLAFENTTLAFENTNLECKKIHGLLKVRSTPIDE